MGLYYSIKTKDFYLSKESNIDDIAIECSYDNTIVEHWQKPKYGNYAVVHTVAIDNVKEKFEQILAKVDVNPTESLCLEGNRLYQIELPADAIFSICKKIIPNYSITLLSISYDQLVGIYDKRITRWITPMNELSYDVVFAQVNGGERVMILELIDTVRVYDTGTILNWHYDSMVNSQLSYDETVELVGKGNEGNLYKIIAII